MNLYFLSNTGDSLWFEDQAGYEWGISYDGVIMDCEGYPMNEEWLLCGDNRDLIEALKGKLNEK